MRLLLRDYEGSRFELWRGGFKFLFGEKGALRGLKQPYLDFYKKDFHPWDHDNSELIARFKEQINEYIAPQYQKGNRRTIQ